MFRKELMYWAYNKQTIISCSQANYRKERWIACHPETTRHSDKEDTALSQLSPPLFAPEKKRSFNKSINQYQGTIQETQDIPMFLVINYNAPQSQVTPRNHASYHIWVFRAIPRGFLRSSLPLACWTVGKPRTTYVCKIWAGEVIESLVGKRFYWMKHDIFWKMANTRTLWTENSNKQV